MDGRGCEDYRGVEVETDVVSNTSGSARVRLVSAGAAARPARVGAQWGPGGPWGARCKPLQAFAAHAVPGEFKAHPDSGRGSV